MRLNNKGFAISSIIYLILMMSIILITVTLFILGNRNVILNKQKNEILSKIIGEEYPNDDYESLTDPNPPQLMGLVPVKYNYDLEYWEIADVNSKWYDYSKQEWANAVILSEGVDNTVGTPLDISTDVIGMFVWIPRYEYKIDGQYGKNGTQEQPGLIQVRFLKGSDSPDIDDGYDTNFGLSEGFWVGKFSTSNDNRVLPGLAYSNEILSQQYLRSKEFADYLSEGQAHLMWDNEWDAVAYLSQSRYGKYGNNSYEGTYKKIYKHTNNHTGSVMSPLSEKIYCDYDDLEDKNDGRGSCGGGASTTGNITGVYDMGGMYDTKNEYDLGEYVMGVAMYNDTGRVQRISVGNSGFSGGYYCSRPSSSRKVECYENTGGDVYLGYDTYVYYMFDYQDSFYGFETEFGYYKANGWYGDYFTPISLAEPWVIRGTSNIFNRGNGYGDEGFPSHVVLIQNI